MENYGYVIIGGGMTGSAALQGIRQVDPSGSIAVISTEADPPYNRPPLTKGLWKGKTVDTIFRKVQYPNTTLFLERTIEKLDPRGKQLTDQNGDLIGYDKLLIATGGTPRELPFGEGHIIYYRTLEDYRKLHSLTETKDRFMVIGGGFIGSEITAALTLQTKDVTIIFPEDAIGWRVFPPDLAAFVSEYYREHGVHVIAKDHVTGVRNENGRMIVTTQAHGDLETDAVVAGIGIVPNVQLAKEAGIDTDNGIIVNAALQTNYPEIFAAGDVAAFSNQLVNTRLRVEHEDNANTMGRMAGRNMAGAHEAYTHIPMFYSDLFDLGYEAVGLTDPHLEIISDWEIPFRKGVVYYLKDAKVRGVLLWNVWDRVNAARALISRNEEVDPIRLKGRITG